MKRYGLAFAVLLVPFLLAQTQVGDHTDGAGVGVGALGGPAGGDLFGTYPNPGVTDNSHAHDESTVVLDAATKSYDCGYIIGDDTGPVLVDTQDQASVCVNRHAVDVTITEVWCETDAGTTTIMLQRDDGTPANLLSANCSCDADGEVCALAGSESTFVPTNRLDHQTVAAGGTAKRVRVQVTGTKQ